LSREFAQTARAPCFVSTIITASRWPIDGPGGLVLVPVVARLQGCEHVPGDLIPVRADDYCGRFAAAGDQRRLVRQAGTVHQVAERYAGLFEAQ
jgi:hypothetical protein